MKALVMEPSSIGALILFVHEYQKNRSLANRLAARFQASEGNKASTTAGMSADI